MRTLKGISLDLTNPDTYYTEEKETDINLATHMLAKGFQNAYDIAILVSGDTDYIKVVETLHNIGKTVVIHDGPDDFRSQPAGNVGKKIACGVICKT